MPSIDLTIVNEVGLHARPAALFVRLANTYRDCTITVQNLTTSSPVKNAKSILAVLSLGVQSGHCIRIETSGEGAEEALTALSGLVQADFLENGLN